MNNGQKRSIEEKKQFRHDAILSGGNPYNVLCATGHKAYGRMVVRTQRIVDKKTGKTKFINHY